MQSPTLLGLFACAVVAGSLPAQDDLAEQKRQRLKDTAADFWIYDDIEQGYAKGRATGKPLLVSIRCVP